MLCRIFAEVSPDELLHRGPMIRGSWAFPGAGQQGTVVSGLFLVDTGSADIAVCESVATSLRLPKAGSMEAHGLSGRAQLNRYSAVLQVPATGPNGENVIFATPMECAGIPGLVENHKQYGLNVIGVIGRRFLYFVNLQVNGQTGALTLDISEHITRPHP